MSPSKYLAYLDANNLYRWAMMKPLPVGDLKWTEEKELENWENIPCILEVDLEKISMICIMIIPLLRKD